MTQQIRFCTSLDGARIAYATAGSGPPLVRVANWVTHLELDGERPIWPAGEQFVSVLHGFLAGDAGRPRRRMALVSRRPASAKCSTSWHRASATTRSPRRFSSARRRCATTSAASSASWTSAAGPRRSCRPARPGRGRAGRSAVARCLEDSLMAAILGVLHCAAKHRACVDWALVMVDGYGSLICPRNEAYDERSL